MKCKKPSFRLSVHKHARTQMQAHKNHCACIHAISLCGTAHKTLPVWCRKAECKSSGVACCETTPRHSELSRWIKTPPPPKSYLCYRAAETNAFALASCRRMRWRQVNLPLLPEQKVYDPPVWLKKKNLRDRRSVRPVCHRAARLESPFWEAQWEGRPSRSRHGAVWKAPGGDGGNLQMKK